MMQIMMLRWMQKTGHKPIVLMGGGTSKIGDPSFKDEARKLLSVEDIARNKAGIQTVFDKYLTFGAAPSDAVMVDNADWLDKLEYIPLLRASGAHFSVNRMLSFYSVRRRLEREHTLGFTGSHTLILKPSAFRDSPRLHQ